MVSHIESFKQKNGLKTRETVPLRSQQKTKDISKHNLKLTLKEECQKKMGQLGPKKDTMAHCGCNIIIYPLL